MRLRGLPGLILLGLVLLLVVPSAVGFYTDWLWFGELGYQSVFLRMLNAQTLVFGLTFAAVYLFLYFNLRFARRTTFERPHIVFGTAANGRTVGMEGRQLAGLAMPVAIVAGLLVGLMNAASWLEWLSFFNGVPFGERDPLFGRDVGFYVYRLPVYQLVRGQALLVTGLALVGCGLYYILSGSFVIESRPGAASWPRLRLVASARRHLSLLVACLLGLLAWGSWLEIPTTLLTTATSSVGFGATYTDVYARIPFLWVSMATLALGAALALWHGFGRRGWPLPLAVALYLLVSVTAGLYGGFVQRFVVTPNEQVKELPYIQNNIAATRRAYALDRVEEREVSGDAELTPADVAENAGTIENVRLWDNQSLLQTFGQIQVIRTYYDFLSVDNDRYVINGRPRQVMLSAREINTENMPNRSWVNERLTFTHGYGLTLGPVNQVTREGLPVLFIRDLPPVSTVDIRLDQPSIYYGELSSDYVVVRTRQPEFHYPTDATLEGGRHGDEYEKTFYSGAGGVPVGSLWRRLLFGIRFASTDILVSTQITRESRILFHRQIGDRVRMLAPFLLADADPYPVISGGRLYWIQDAYTTTSNYPYSLPRLSPGLNYIRNSVKITIDAYNGTVALYLADADDPLARTLSRIFPGLLKPLSEMPPDLRSHVRYPEDLFRFQAQIFQTYHMTNPQVFYNKEDQWQIPSQEGGQTATPMQPYYAMMRLPGEKQVEFIQMLPFTPRAKNNLSAWMVARSDGSHYGHLLVFQFPKQKLIYGPQQINARISQDQVISPQVTLWNQQGSEVKWSPLLVIPIKDSIIYVRSLYLRSPEGRIPELKRVVVAYQSRIVMAETLSQALVQIFGRSLAASLPPDQLESSATSVVETPTEAETVEPPAPTAPATAADMKALAAEAQTHLENADRARRDGNWALFGEELQKLQAVVDRMNR
jgi:uncharacterized membrane protein (UPF0182 family)